MNNRIVLTLAILVAWSTTVAIESSGDEVTTYPSTELEYRPMRDVFFEKNIGQTGSEHDFVSRIGNTTVYIGKEEIVFSATSLGTQPNRRPFDTATPSLRIGSGNRTVLRAQWIDTYAPKPKTYGEKLDSTTNYYVPNDPSHSVEGVPHYQKVGFTDLYNGVDIVYYEKGGQIEYDLIVEAGADPSAIRLRFDGSNEISVDADGSLVIHAEHHEFRQRIPLVYQPTDDGRRRVDAEFRKVDSNTVGFQITDFDPELPLIIDPTIDYASYVGTVFSDFGEHAVFDSNGNMIIVGGIAALDFVSPNQFDILITMLVADGSSLQYQQIVIAGDSGDEVSGIALDDNGQLFIVGDTESTNLATSGSADPTCGIAGDCKDLNGNIKRDAFVAKVSTLTGSLVAATYYGGSDWDSGNGIAINNLTGEIIFTGGTSSDDLTLAAAIDTSCIDAGQTSCSRDAFVAKLSEDLGSLTYSTYLGDEGDDVANGLTLDDDGAIHIAGVSNNNAFVAKLTPSASILSHWTTIGGTSIDGARAIAVDNKRRPYVVGQTTSTDFPAVRAFQSDRGCTNAAAGTIECDPLFDASWDGFIFRLSADASRLEYSSYLGGDGYEEPRGVAVNSKGEAHVVGWTTSTGEFLKSNNPNNFSSGEQNGFLTIVSDSGFLKESYFLGGSGTDSARSVYIDSSDNILVAGDTFSDDFEPLRLGAYQESRLAGADAFVVRFEKNPLEVVDIHTFRKNGQVITNIAELAFLPNATPVIGIAADGANDALVRLTDLPEPGTVTFSLEEPDGTQGAGEHGFFDTPSGGIPAGIYTVHTEPLGNDNAAFAVWMGPSAFARTPLEEQLESRPVVLRAEFFPDAPTSLPRTFIRELEIHRPPVLLLHGAWIDEQDWKWNLIQDSRFFACTMDTTGLSSGASLPGTDTFANYFAGECQERLLREKGVSASQVDLFAHGTTGILARQYMMSADSVLRDFDFRGTVNKFITVDTPHTGALFANLINNLVEGPIAGDAVALMDFLGFCWRCWPGRQLTEASVVINDLQTQCNPTHYALVGSGGELFETTFFGNAPIKYDFASSKPLKQVKVIRWFAGWLIAKILAGEFGTDHDAISRVESQAGGLDPSNFNDYAGVLSTERGLYWFMPSDNQPIDAQNLSPNDDAIALLNRSSNDPIFADGCSPPSQLITSPQQTISIDRLDAGQEKVANIASDPLALEFSNLVVTSPAPGAIYAPGDTVTVTVEPVGAYVPESVGVLTPMGVRMFDSAPYSDDFQVPLDSIGTQEIRAIATANGGSQLDAAPIVTFQVQVSSSLTGIRAPNGKVLGASATNNPSIYVVGQYDDGVDRNLSGSDLGTTYVSNNTEIATVDQNGIVTGIRDGSTTISVFNSAFAVNVDVLVSGVSAAPQFRLVPFADDLYVDELFEYTLRASDSDGTIPILTVENLPPNATFSDNGDGTAQFSWMPTLSDIGSYGVVFTATDAVDPTMDGGFVFAFNVKERPNIPPVSDAGPDQTVSPGEIVTLSGSASNDPDGTIVGYSWQLLPFITYLTGSAGAELQFIAPDVAFDTDLLYELTVTDDEGATSIDTVVVTVQLPPMPIADAGIDQTVDEGTVVTLDGSASSHENGTLVSYQWQQIAPASPIVTLTGAATPVANFTAPDINVDTNFTFLLRVTDTNSLTDTDGVNILVSFVNQPPVANAGLGQTVTEGDPTTLNGSGSADPDGLIASYSWTQIGGPSVVLTGSNTAMPTFSAPMVDLDTDLTFELTVTDNIGATGSNSVTVTVLAILEDLDSDGLPDSWELANFGDLTSQDGNGDPDGDGITNLQEYEEGTDPNITAPVPSQVSELNVLAGDSQNIVVWSNSAGVATYNIYWSTSPGVTPINGNAILGVNSPFMHTGLTNDTPYYYVITASNNSGESVPSIEETGTPGSPVWSMPQAISNSVTVLGAVGPDGLGKQIDVVTDSLGNSMVAWWGPDPSTSIQRAMVAKYSPASGWGQAEALDVDVNQKSEWPKIAMNADGEAIAIWTKFDGVKNNLWAKSYDPGSDTWGAQFLLETLSNTVNPNTINVSMSDSGVIGVVWTTNDSRSFIGGNTLNVRTAYANIFVPGAGWIGQTLLDPSTGVGESRITDVASDLSGNIVFVWQRENCDSAQSSSSCTGDSDIVSKSYQTNQGWSSTTILDAATNVSNPSIAVNSHGDGAAVWTEQATAVGREFSFQNGWNASSEVLNSGSNSVFFPQMAINDAGQGLTTWNRFSNSNQTRGNTLVVGQGWGGEDVIDRRSSPFEALALSNSGTGFVLVERSTDNELYAIDYSTSTGWGGLSTLGPGNIDSDEPNIDMDPYGNAFAVWATNGELRVSRYGAPQVVVPNNPPTSNAGIDQTVTEGAIVNLDGSGSSDSDGTIASYSWSQTAGPAVALSDATVASPSFTAPAVSTDTTLSFSLTVTDNEGATGMDSVDVVVQVDLPNVPPTSNAGIDQTITEGTVVNLDGSGSSDSDGTIASYAWSQTAGPVVTLSDSTIASPSFTAPGVTGDTTLSFSLTVTDNEGATAQDAVDILVQVAPPNAPPTANAGLDQTVTEGVLVNLDGSASSDSDGNITNYAWLQTVGPAATLSDATAISPSFTAPAVTSDTILTFSLTVTDNDSATAQDTVDILVQDAGADTTPPITTITATRIRIQGTTFYDVELTTNEPGSTSFSITGDGVVISGGVNTTAFQAYTGVFRVEVTVRKGAATLSAFSTDIAGNVEATQMLPLPW